MKMAMPFGVSTHVFYGQRLSADHLKKLRCEPFTHVELFCALHHFDFHDQNQIREVVEGLHSSGLKVNSLHSPFYTLDSSGERAYYSISSSDETERRHALSEIKSAAALRSVFEYSYLVVHLGPTGERHRLDDLEQGKRSLHELLEYCSSIGVGVAVENIPNSFSTTESLARLGEQIPDLLFCFDSGHANMEGNPERTVTTLGPRIRTTHLHDNSGQSDEHRMPYDGTVPWSKVMRALKGQNYPGIYLLEIREAPRSQDWIAAAQATARRMAAEC